MGNTSQFYNKEKSFMSLQPLKGNVEYLTVLVELSHIGIVDGDRTNQFYNKSTRLLDYIIEINDSKLALLLVQTLFHIQNHTKFNITNDKICIKQLCELILIQFDRYKEEIFLYVLKLLNFVDKDTNNSNQFAVVFKPILTKIEGNIYECFRLDLAVELLHSYLLYDYNVVRDLFIDILTDWSMFESSYNEELFEKLLWYGFLVGEEQYLAESLYEYDEFIKSDRWGVKFYLYLLKKLTKNSPIDLSKVIRAIAKYKKLHYYSNKEKNFITNKIQVRLNNHVKHTKTTNQTIKKKHLEKEELISTVIRLSPYNLPKGTKLESIKLKKQVKLTVFKNEKKNQVIKYFPIEVLTSSDNKNYYVTRATIKKLKEEIGPYYIDLIEKRTVIPSVQNTGLFAWPSTEITGTGFEANNDTNGFNQKSALMNLGYQITGKNKEQRWSILERAVPAIGLKKVAYTIAGNIKLRKGQKNGRIKYSHAISEWEYDLNKLKSKYYKKDFIWPST